MLVLKVQSVCVAMEAFGESTTVALEVGRVRPSQLGNVSLRQYLSNRSLGEEDRGISCTRVPLHTRGVPSYIKDVMCRIWHHCHRNKKQHYWNNRTNGTKEKADTLGFCGRSKLIILLAP